MVTTWWIRLTGRQPTGFKRRPYVTVGSSSTCRVPNVRRSLRGVRADAVRDEARWSNACVAAIRFQAGDGSRRDPIVNLRLAGTLLLVTSRSTSMRYVKLWKETLEALYVQPTDNAGESDSGTTGDYRS